MNHPALQHLIVATSRPHPDFPVSVAELGIGPLDRVSASLPNDADIVVMFLGTMRLGAIWAGIGFTSGTTGQPKAAVHSQHNMVVSGLMGSSLKPGGRLPAAGWKWNRKAPSRGRHPR